LIIQPSAAVVTPYFDNLAGFNSDAGTPPVLVDFDLIPPNTPIPGVMINGFTILPLGPALPFVIRASDSVTPAGFAPTGPNQLIATSGQNVVSPGGIILAPGPNDPIENDDMILVFTPPVKAVGFDLLFQSLDGFSFAGISVFDVGNNALYTNGNIPIPALPGAPSPGGSIFVGFVSDSENIARIIIDDMDGNSAFHDSNIGLDTIRFTRDGQPTSCGDGTCNGDETCESCPADCGSCPAVPEFPSVFLPATMIIGLLGAVLLIQRTREH
jgi:hypothetical protein